MTTTMIADFTLPQRSVLDSTMAYREMGRPGAPVALFLHGNPTSSYIWRNIIPFVAPVARCIAPDLIGYGQSGKPDIDYRFEDQVRYLDAFITAAGIRSAYLVAQDWGTALAFHLAARRPDFVRGLAFMEFIRPMPTWDDFHQVPAARETFRKFRTPGEGEQMILDGNAFVERILPGSILRKLSEEEMAVYRAPFPTPESRRPTWRLPNELPIAGEPADVYAILERAHAALASSHYPKLLFCGDPGALVSPALPSVLLPACTIANWCNSARAPIICRRIIPRRSAKRPRPGSPEAKADSGKETRLERRMVVDETGAVVQRPAVDFGYSLLPKSVRKAGR